MMASKKPCVGIDFGTSSCRAAIVLDGNVEVLENEFDNSSIPSYVAFTETGGRLVGERAKEQIVLNSKNTFFGIKRLIGLRSDKVRDEVKNLYLPPNTFNDGKGFEITASQCTQNFSPEQIAAMIISKMKDLADDKLKVPVSNAVITVPSNFNSYQRQAIKDAGIVAGFKSIRLLNEPTAAAVDYSETLSANDSQTILVLDFGAGQLSATVANVKNGSVQVQGSSVARFGSMDIDAMLMKHCFHNMKVGNTEVYSNTKAIERLRSSCESNRSCIMDLPQFKINLECFHEDRNYEFSFSDSDVIDQITEKFQKLVKQTVSRALQKSFTTMKKSITVFDKVLLLGGCSKFPLLKKLVENVVTNMCQVKTWDVTPDRVVRGAALYAANLMEDHTVTEIRVEDRLHREISAWKSFVNKNEIIVKENAYLKSNHTFSCYLGFKLQEKSDDDCYTTVGEGYGSLVLSFDDSATLHVERKYKYLGNLAYSNLYFDSYHVERYIDAERNFKRKELDDNKKLDLLFSLENEGYRLKQELQKIPLKSSPKLGIIVEKINSILEWLDENPHPMEEEINSRKIILEEIKNQMSFDLNSFKSEVSELTASQSKSGKALHNGKLSQDYSQNHNRINLNHDNYNCDYFGEQSSRKLDYRNSEENSVHHHSFGIKNDHPSSSKTEHCQQFDSKCGTSGSCAGQYQATSDGNLFHSDLSASSVNTLIRNHNAEKKLFSQSTTGDSNSLNLYDASHTSLNITDHSSGNSSNTYSKNTASYTDGHSWPSYLEKQSLSSGHEESKRWSKITKLIENHSRILPPVDGINEVTRPPMHQGSKCVAIGIDLGTQASCVSAVVEGKVLILEDLMGSKCIPSYVSFTSTERLFGEAAKNKVTVNAPNTIYSAKGFYRHDTLSSFEPKQSTAPNLVTDEGKLGFQVQYRKKKIFLQPKEVNAMLLSKMKKLVEQQLNCVVQEAVIAVPSYFTNEQRQDTKDAAEIAGLNLLSLINEPVAATVCYKDNKRHIDKQCLLVLDAGAGGTSVAVTIIDGTVIKVLAMGGTSKVSGNELDRKLMEYFVPMVEEKCGRPITDNRKGLERLRLACQDLKHRLTLLEKYEIVIESLCNDNDFELSLTRKQFKDMCYSDFNRELSHVINRILKEAEISSLEIDELLLVGGTSRVPFMEDIALATLGKTSSNRNVNVNESVASGAAVHALCLSKKLSSVTIDDVVVNRLFPDKDDKRFIVVPKDGLGFVEGSDWIVDTCGIFHNVGDFSSHQQQRKESIEQLSKKLKDFDNDEKELEVLSRAVNDLEDLCLRTASSLKRKIKEDRTSVEEKRFLLSFCNETLDWLNDHEDTSLDDVKEKRCLIDDMFHNLGSAPQ